MFALISERERSSQIFSQVRPNGGEEWGMNVIRDLWLKFLEIISKLGPGFHDFVLNWNVEWERFSDLVDRDPKKFGRASKNLWFILYEMLDLQ